MVGFGDVDQSHAQLAVPRGLGQAEALQPLLQLGLHLRIGGLAQGRVFRIGGGAAGPRQGTQRHQYNE